MSLQDANQVAVEAGQQAHDAILALLVNLGVPRSYATTVASGVAAIIAALGFSAVIFFAALFRLAAELVAVFLGGVTAVRESSQAAINDVIASALTDIMGVPISPSQLPTNSGQGGNLQEFIAIGKAVLNAITSEIGGGAGTGGGPGEQAAQAFLGRGIAFAVNASLLSVVAELASVGFIKEFKEVGEELQANIGFGRLMRLALQPIIHGRITLPYTREVNAAYRPVRLAQREYLDAFYSGRMDEATLGTNLAEHGFSDDLIAELKAQHAPKLSVDAVDRLIRWGKLDQTAGVAMLVAQGWPQSHAQAELDSVRLAAADREENAYAAEILKLAQAREIAPETFSTLIQRLHLSQEQQQGYLNRLGVYLDSYTKRLNLGEMLYLLEKNLLTTSQLEAWITAEGYNADTAAMLELYFDSKALDYQQALKIKEDKAKAAAAKAKAKGQPPPPSIINP